VKLLDRYVLRSFLEPFLLCFFGFLGIWLVFDLQDNLGDFLSAKASLRVVAGFYLTQLPAIVMIVLPVGLLLALLFSLSRMSRTNELIAQLTAGRSVLRIITPLFGIGLACTGGLAYLNYELAPHAEGIKKEALKQLAKGRKKLESEALEAHLFRDRLTGRTWYVEKMRIGSPTLDNVHIIQQDEEGNILRKWYANRAIWDPRSKNWALMRGVIVEFDKDGNELKRDSFAQPGEFRAMKDWSETPWRIASSDFEPQDLSVPELKDYLRWNSDFPEVSLAPFRTYLAHRLAMPWTCLVVVLIAAPLGIVFNRRGVLAGVAWSIFIFFGMVFLTNLFLALGKGMRVSAFTAAWAPNLAIALIGVVLLYFRSTNRDLPRLRFKRS
jgi:LPS export ABC transporter permease LptG